ncbi:MAG: CDP-alcohol phosphatidyltransferase family protein [Gemmatimonadaceae bacterium]|nr:CDP-alcohol phosphatidyltransferase family protein [Chitinophagaceae bacterium]
MKQIPNIFTLLNLFFGCCAIVYILQNGISVMYNPSGGDFIGMPEQIVMGSLFIGLAAVVDFLDGFVARMFKATSEMGKQLDSLADLVSFGVAPGMIIYQFLRISYASQPNGLDISFLLLLPAFLIPCAAAYRLAKFNLDEGQQYGFKGVPTPAVGLLIASFPLIYWYSSGNETVSNLIQSRWLLYFVIIAVSYLMVSNLPMLSLKFRDYSIKNNIPKIILALVAVLGAIFIGWLAVPLLFVFYIVLSLAFKNKNP